MIKEIYCRMPSDANYKRNGSVIESTSMEENLLQRIRICLGTRKGEVLGDPFFGINLEDYIFDMGPDGGRRGGYIVAQGTPEELAMNPDSVTGPYLKEVLDGNLVSMK